MKSFFEKTLKIATMLALIVVFVLSVLLRNPRPVQANNFRPTDAETDAINRENPANQVYQLGTKVRNSLYAGKPFKATVVISSSNYTGPAYQTVQQTTVSIVLPVVPDTETVGASVYITGWQLSVNGPAKWDSTTTFVGNTFDGFTVQATTGDFMFKVSSTSLLGNRFIVNGSSEPIYGVAFKNSTGTLSGWGLQLITNSTVALTGSDIYLTLTGVIR